MVGDDNLTLFHCYIMSLIVFYLTRVALTHAGVWECRLEPRGFENILLEFLIGCGFLIGGQLPYFGPMRCIFTPEEPLQDLSKLSM